VAYYNQNLLWQGALRSIARCWCKGCCETCMAGYFTSLVYHYTDMGLLINEKQLQNHHGWLCQSKIRYITSSA
jgi:hypothetical protein